jgi:hypothetical protein
VDGRSDRDRGPSSGQAEPRSNQVARLERHLEAKTH